jgi:flagellar FliJ protein
LRKYHEKEWELKLARAVGECVRTERNIQSHIFERARTLKTRRMEGPVQIETLICSEQYMRRLFQEERVLEEELILKEQQRLQVQRAFIEASKKRKVLDNLKNRKALAFYKEQRINEMKEIDDLNNATYVRNKQY